MIYHSDVGWTDEEDTQMYTVVQEVKFFREHTVYATSLQDAISKIENNETANVYTVDDTCHDEVAGRVVSARVEEE